MSPSKRQSIMSLIINKVYSRDKVKRMINDGVQSSNEFLWKIYLQYDYVERISLAKERKNLANKQKIDDV